MSRLQRRRRLVRQLYGFDFPEDLDRFWEFACRLRPLDPLGAFRDSLEIELTGPFDVLWGRFDNLPSPPSPYLHWRYYNDPPELFTVLVGGGTGHHWGYFLDDPADGGSWCVASSYAEDADEFGQDDNLFEAVRLVLEDGLAAYEQDVEDGLEDAATLTEARERAQEVRHAVQQYATGGRPEIGAEYVDRYAAGLGKRRPVADTFEGLGIVVPAERYRPLSRPDKALWQSLCETDDPADVVAEAWQALAEGCPGTALKLGKDLWAIGGQEHQQHAFELLDSAYNALGRDILRDVLLVHWQYRDRPWLDVLHTLEPG
jgi:hypothetical protein